jgi:hypothetical protein
LQIVGSREYLRIKKYELTLQKPIHINSTFLSEPHN